MQDSKVKLKNGKTVTRSVAAATMVSLFATLQMGMPGILALIALVRYCREGTAIPSKKIKYLGAIVNDDGSVDDDIVQIVLSSAQIGENEFKFVQPYAQEDS